MIIKVQDRIFSFFLFSLSLSVLIVFPCYSAPGDSRAPAQTGIVEEIRGLTESGILSSMLQALELIRSRQLSGVEFGRLMTGVNTVLIGLVYPDSPASLPAVDLPQTHSYTRIMREAERGVYVRPAANSDDFFEHILPFLAVNAQTRQETLVNALSDLQKAGELRPNSVLPYYFQGIIHEYAGRYSQAETAYRAAYGISAECYPALMGAARMRRLAGNTSEATSIFNDLMIRYPDSINIKRELALTYFENREWSRALTLIDEILLSEPRNGEFLLMKARVFIEQGNFSQANAILDNYASINSSDRTYLFYRARLQAEGYRNRDSALNYLRSILRTDSNDTQALVYAVELLMESQRPADQIEGRELLGRLRQISGSSVDVLALSLQDAVRMENWQEAQIFLARVLAVRRTPEDLINAYYVERGLRNNARMMSYARELYEQDSLNNDYAIIYISALIDNGRRDEALRLIESRINSLSGGSVKGQFFYLRSRLQSNEENALSDLRSCIFEDPRNLDALIAMFDIHYRRREERRAVYYLRQAIAIAPDNLRVKRYETEYKALLDRN